MTNPENPPHETIGKYRIGLSFNPSKDKTVDMIKAYAAAFIDAIEMVDIRVGDTEQIRLKALAMTAAEEAAMWAVKAQTKPERSNG